jgi:hypothetical protein
LKSEIDKHQMAVLERRIADQKDVFERAPSSSSWGMPEAGQQQQQQQQSMRGPELNGYTRPPRAPHHDMFQQLQSPTRRDQSHSGFNNFNMNNLNNNHGSGLQHGMFSSNSLLPERTQSATNLQLSPEQQTPYSGYIPPISRPKPKSISPINHTTMTNLEADFERMLNGGLLSNPVHFNSFPPNTLPHHASSSGLDPELENNKSFGFGAGLWDMASPILSTNTDRGGGLRPSQNGVLKHAVLENNAVPSQQLGNILLPDNNHHGLQQHQNSYHGHGHGHMNGIEEPRDRPFQHLSSPASSNDSCGSGDSSQGASKSPEVSSPLEEVDFPPLPQPKKTPSSEWVQVKAKKQQKGPQQPQQQHNHPTKAPPPEDKSADEKIRILCNMGFDKRRCIKALQFGDKDLDKAVEILLSGQLRPAKPVA